VPRPAPFGTARRARLFFPGVVFAVAVIAALLLPVERAVPLSHGSEFKRTERALMELVDRARARRGLPQLDWRPAVGDVARRHSDRMRERREVYHGRLERMLADFRWRLAGDAVGCSPAVREAFRGFMESPPHRKLILKAAFERMGVGIEARGDLLYVTILFLD
jgi:uncharacterized protein YkwD